MSMQNDHRKNIKRLPIHTAGDKIGIIQRIEKAVSVSSWYPFGLGYTALGKEPLTVINTAAGQHISFAMDHCYTS